MQTEKIPEMKEVSQEMKEEMEFMNEVGCRDVEVDPRKNPDGVSAPFNPLPWRGDRATEAHQAIVEEAFHAAEEGTDPEEVLKQAIMSKVFGGREASQEEAGRVHDLYESTKYKNVKKSEDLDVVENARRSLRTVCQVAHIIDQIGFQQPAVEELEMLAEKAFDAMLSEALTEFGLDNVVSLAKGGVKPFLIMKTKKDSETAGENLSDEKLFQKAKEIAASR